MSWAPLHTTESWVHLRHITRLMNDTKLKWFGYLCLIIGNLKLVSSGRWIWKLCFVPQSGIRQMPAIHLAVRLIFRSSTEIHQVPASPDCTARGSQGPQQFSGWKYLPAHRGLAMVNVKRAIFLALFWDLFTSFHAELILTHVPFHPFLESPPERFRHITIVWDNFSSCSCVMSTFLGLT